LTAATATVKYHDLFGAAGSGALGAGITMFTRDFLLAWVAQDGPDFMIDLG
jgi:hypothetical protein